MTQTVGFAHDNLSLARLPQSLQSLVILLSQTRLDPSCIEQYGIHSIQNGLTSLGIAKCSSKGWPVFPQNLRGHGHDTLAIQTACLQKNVTSVNRKKLSGSATGPS